MDLALVLAVAFVALIGCLVLALRSGGSSAGPPGLRSSRAVTDSRERLEEEDLQQLLQATNARRLARGLPERTLEQAVREFDVPDALD